MAAKDAEAKRGESFSPRDIRESFLSQLDPELLEILLKNHSTGGNIRWGSSFQNRIAFENWLNCPLN